MSYLLHVLVLIEIYAIAAIALDLIAGEAGVVSVAHAALFGVGAYTSAILSLKAGLPFLASASLGALAALLCSAVVSLPSMRLYDDYFVMATFGCQMVVFTLFNNWDAVTRGPRGIFGVPPASIAGARIDSSSRFCLLGGVAALLTWTCVAYIRRSPFGRVLHAIREDEVFARSLGKSTVTHKIIAVAISAFFTGLAGSLYAHYLSYIDPRSFATTESIALLSAVIIGGAGSRFGPVLGVVVVVGLPELLRFVGFPSAFASNMRQIIYGMLLIFMMRFRPRGLVGRYAFDKS